MQQLGDTSSANVTFFSITAAVFIAAFIIIAVDAWRGNSARREARNRAILLFVAMVFLGTFGAASVGWLKPVLGTLPPHVRTLLTSVATYAMRALFGIVAACLAFAGGILLVQSFAILVGWPRGPLSRRFPGAEEYWQLVARRDELDASGWFRVWLRHFVAGLLALLVASAGGVSAYRWGAEDGAAEIVVTAAFIGVQFLVLLGPTRWDRRLLRSLDDKRATTLQQSPTAERPGPSAAA